MCGLYFVSCGIISPSSLVVEGMLCLGMDFMGIELALHGHWTQRVDIPISTTFFDSFLGRDSIDAHCIGSRSCFT